MRAEREMVGAAARAHRTMQASVQDLVFAYRARTAVTHIPSEVLFAWLVRYAAWCVTRVQTRVVVSGFQHKWSLGLNDTGAK